jgi:ankyrin
MDVDAQNREGATALHSAVIGGAYEIVEILLRSGANTELRDNQEYTPLFLASNMYGMWQSDILGLLIQYGANVNVATQKGYSPLHCAAFEGNAALVRRLLDAGADRNVRTADGETAADIAAYYGHHSVVEALEA